MRQLRRDAERIFKRADDRIHTEGFMKPLPSRAAIHQLRRRRSHVEVRNAQRGADEFQAAGVQQLLKDGTVFRMPFHEMPERSDLAETEGQFRLSRQ
ncbi:hypothetical protein SDC9_190159 [bioreactor metagenome]|uniref:Uncharacterized protein n=1 Tax=bioreactor metagenome TaxID=1076179 RepID=A0A645HVW2_9ZZZZ